MIFKPKDLKKPLVIAGPCSAENKEQILSTAKSLSKDVSIFSPFSVVSLGDSKTYYINNTSGFTQAFEGNDSFLESVANLRATPGSNMGVTQNNFDLLLSRNTYLQNSISSNQDIDLAKETAELTRTELLLQMNHSVNVQAREISRNVTLALIQ